VKAAYVGGKTKIGSRQDSGGGGSLGGERTVQGEGGGEGVSRSLEKVKETGGGKLQGTNEQKMIGGWGIYSGKGKKAADKIHMITRIGEVVKTENIAKQPESNRSNLWGYT